MNSNIGTSSTFINTENTNSTVDCVQVNFIQNPALLGQDDGIVMLNIVCVTELIFIVVQLFRNDEIISWKIVHNLCHHQ